MSRSNTARRTITGHTLRPVPDRRRIPRRRIAVRTVNKERGAAFAGDVMLAGPRTESRAAGSFPLPSQAQQQVPDRSRLGQERVVAGVEFDDAAGPAGELAL